MQNYPTLMDVARRSGDAKIKDIVEVLNQTNYILDDIPWLPCNSGQTHITTIRTGIPTPTWRMLNAGVPKGKTKSKQIKASCGMLELYSEVDAKLVSMAEDKSDFLKTENDGILEGFSQEISRVLFYGDPANPIEPVGLVNYYNSLSSGETSSNVINGGGSGADNSSIWLVCWGERAVHGLFPKGSSAGLTEDFKGKDTVSDGNGGQFEAYRTHYTWDAGIVVRDWRCAVRIANIDMSDLDAGNANAADLITLMIKAVHKLPKAAAGLRKGFYCRKEVATALDLQSRKATNLMLSYQDVFGKEVLTFRGIPIREQESLLSTEAAVA